MPPADDPAPVLQTKDELDDFWSKPDPWDYDVTSDDEVRVARLLSALPTGREYERTLDIGCGNGFLTHRLPGDEVVGVDISASAIEWARRRVAERDDSERFTFEPASVFDLTPNTFGTFDLIVITGVLYPQYIGNAFTVVTELVRALARPMGILASVQIDQWFPYRFPFTSLTISVDAYREYSHRLEVFEIHP